MIESINKFQIKVELKSNYRTCIKEHVTSTWIADESIILSTFPVMPNEFTMMTHLRSNEN